MFPDVTMVSDDGIQIPAHKFVLASYSPILRSLLFNNPHPHPMIYMRGVRQQELQSILQFMYLGETNIGQERFREFAEVATDLQIKEIIQSLSAESTLERNNSRLIKEIEPTNDGNVNTDGTLYTNTRDDICHNLR